MNARERFLAACRREPVDATPVWFMRQAGRYLPEYRALRKRHTILELATTPDLATEVALQPLRVLDVDAAILFADIVLPLQAMGADVDLVENVGPVVAKPVRTLRDVEDLHGVNVTSDLGYVLETVARLREALDGERALVGFSGAPFTLASYLIEGRPNRDFLETKRFLLEQPEAWHLLMQRLAKVVSDYVESQARAGADAIQLFDSWAGHLDPGSYNRAVAPYTSRVLEALEPAGVPRILFATPTAGLLGPMRSSGAEVLGLDWRVDLEAAARFVGPDVALQGNLDPATLAVSWDAARDESLRILAGLHGRPGHVFNLGHGILPSTPVEHARRLVDLVHAETRKEKQAVAA